MISTQTSGAWHQLAGSRAMPYDIVGYTYRAENYCPSCVRMRLADRFPVAFYDTGSSGEMLDRAAAQLGIDREDERSFDSEDFPKVIFRDSAEAYEAEYGPVEAETCGRCEAELD